MREAVDWIGVTSGCKFLSTSITETGFHPDRVVAIARGGVVPGLLLAYALDVGQFDSVTIRYLDASRTKLRISSPVPDNLRKARVLLVEDFLVSGKSMKCVADVLREKGADVRSAAFCVSHEAVCRPDFSLGFASVAPVFPWERWDDPS